MARFHSESAPWNILMLASANTRNLKLILFVTSICYEAWKQNCCFMTQSFWFLAPQISETLNDWIFEMGKLLGTCFWNYLPITQCYMSFTLLRRNSDQSACNKMLSYLSAKAFPTDPGCGSKIAIHMLSVFFIFQYEVTPISTSNVPSSSSLVPCSVRNDVIFAYTRTEIAWVN